MTHLSSSAVHPFAGRLSPKLLGGGRSRIAKVRLSLREREAFYRRAYAEDRAPSLLLRRFAEAYARGETVPPLSDTSSRHEASHLAGPVAFALSCDLHERLRAGGSRMRFGQPRLAPVRAGLCGRNSDRGVRHAP